MPAIAVDPTHYEAASACLGHEVADGLSSTLAGLARELAGTGEMAGHDPGGREWGAQYDESALGVITTIATLQRAARTMATLLQRCGLNHGVAEADSMSAHRVDVVDSANYAGDMTLPTTCGVVPMAAGGSSDYPMFWDLVHAAVGFQWPDGRTDRLRAAGRAWSAAATAIDGLTASVDRAVEALCLSTSPEVPDAVIACRGLRRHLSEVSGGCGDVASTAAEFASRIDSARSDAEDELLLLGAASVATEAVGAVVSVFTFGAAEAPTQVVEASEIAAVAARVRIVLGALSARCATLINSIRGVTVAMSEAEVELTAVAEADVVVAETTAVAQTEAALDAELDATAKAELDATSHLAAAADSDTIDLRAMEGRGHTIERHVAKSDEYLIGRTHEKLASTFSDLGTAERLTRSNIARNKAVVDGWLTSGKRRLVINGPAPGSAGRIYVRASGQFVSPSSVRTVLERTGDGYIVLTSFPDL